jgi:hypothetical protein
MDMPTEEQAREVHDEVKKIVERCRPGTWPIGRLSFANLMNYAARMSIRANFPIPGYMLDAPVSGLDGLVEFTAKEYQTMGGRMFEGERSYNARQIDFCGQRWEVQLQTVEGQISKIALHAEFRTGHEGKSFAMRMLDYCTERLGQPSTPYHPAQFVWDSTDGNVILLADETVIDLFLTSRSVRNLKLRKPELSLAG